MPALVILMASILILPLAFADPKYCENLMEVACAPGDTKDSSGSASTNIDRVEVSQAINSYKQDISDKFLKIIQNPDQKYFRDICLSTLGYKNSPECQAADSGNRALCDKKIADGLFHLAATKVYSEYPGPKFKDIPLAQLNFVARNKNFLDVLRNLKEQLEKDFTKDQIAEKIDKQILPEVKTQIIKKLRELNIDPQNLEKMVDRIKSIEFGGTNCDLYVDPSVVSIDRTLMPNAFFNPLSNELRICNGLLLLGQSDYHIAHVVAHEVAHSMGPCVMQASRSPGTTHINYSKRSVRRAEKQYHIPNLLQCLRDSKSVRAKRVDNFVVSEWRKAFGITNVFCGVDQIDESIADWFAAEVVASRIQDSSIQDSPIEVLKAVSNVWKPLCGNNPKGSEASSKYPKGADRVNRILLQQPGIRERLGCNSYKKDVGYCDGISTEPKQPVLRTSQRVEYNKVEK